MSENLFEYSSSDTETLADRDPPRTDTRRIGNLNHLAYIHIHIYHIYIYLITYYNTLYVSLYGLFMCLMIVY